MFEFEGKQIIHLVGDWLDIVRHLRTDEVTIDINQSDGLLEWNIDKKKLIYLRNMLNEMGLEENDSGN